MLKDILIVAHFTQIPGDKGNGRFHYIAEKIDAKENNVELISTNFSHTFKRHRTVSESDLQSVNYKFTMLNEPGYKKNISIRRVYSHYVMSINLKKYLNTRKKPDVIYCSLPSLSVGKVASIYAKKNDIPFIIDIQDLWPEAFKMVVNIPIISDLFFLPMKIKANYIYKSADEIIAVSQTYLNRALKVNKKSKASKSIYLGTQLEKFDEFSNNTSSLEKPNNEIWLVYIGSLSYSYDIPTVIDALAILETDGIEKIKFVVIGDGPLKTEFEKYAKEKNINIKFTGKLSYKEMVRILVSCDIAVNPIKKGSAGSIINKVGDYAAAGLPVLNTQESLEYQQLIINNNIGFNCDNGNPKDMANKILLLTHDETLRNTMGNNNRLLAKLKFDRDTTYPEIIDLLTEKQSPIY